MAKVTIESGLAFSKGVAKFQLLEVGRGVVDLLVSVEGEPDRSALLLPEQRLKVRVKEGTYVAVWLVQTDILEDSATFRCSQIKACEETSQAQSAS
jgi:hypothetical protein